MHLRINYTIYCIINVMRRRNGFGFGIFGLIFLVAIIGDVAYGLVYLAIALVPLAALGMLIYAVVKGANKASANTNNYSSGKAYNLNNADINKIDKKLNNYFKKNISLPVIDGVSLTTQSGKFTTVDQLYLTYKDEKICKLCEFRNQYGDVYKKIMDLLLVFSNKGDDVLKADVKTEDIKPSKKLSDADKYIDEINKLNDAIPQEEITNGLYQTCDLIKQVDLLSENHKDNNKITKLYDYYLPILVSALEKYKKLQDSKVKGDDFNQTEAGLIKTIVLINEALKTICSSMQEDEYMNINADVNTLQSLLEKDGYGKDPFRS